MATEVGIAYLSILPSTKGFASNLSRDLDGPFTQAGTRGGDQIGDGVGKSKGFAAAGAKVGGIFAAAFAAIGVAQIAGSVKDFVADIISSGSDLNETINKSNTIFGKNADEIDKWAKGAAESVGLSRAAALEAAAGFGNMFQQLGFTGDQAAAMSTDVVQLSADLGSFNNLPTDDVAERIAAAFRGEYDSLQLLIPNINAARVEQEAMAASGKTNASELTAQEKAAAVLAIVHRDGAAAAGDFAKTSDQLANSQKIASAEFENAKTAIGTALLPVATELFNTFRDVGVPALQDLATWFTENKDQIAEMAVNFVSGGLAIVEMFLTLASAGLNFEAGWLEWIQSAIDAWFGFVGAVLQGAEDAFGWVPGLGPKLDEAHDKFDTFAQKVDESFDMTQQAARDTADQFDAAKDAVEGLRQKVLALNGIHATVFLNAQGNMVTGSENGFRVAGGGNIPAFRAAGGPVRAGMPYIVGENSPELFVPDRNGQIYNPSQIAGMASQGGGFPSAVTLVDENGSILAHTRAIVADQAASAQRTNRQTAIARGLNAVRVGG